MTFLKKKFYVVYLQSFKAIQRMFCVDFAKNFYSQRWFALSCQGTRDGCKRFRLRLLLPAEKKPRAEQQPRVGSSEKNLVCLNNTQNGTELGLKHLYIYFAAAFQQRFKLFLLVSVYKMCSGKWGSSKNGKQKQKQTKNPNARNSNRGGKSSEYSKSTLIY